MPPPCAPPRQSAPQQRPGTRVGNGTGTYPWARMIHTLMVMHGMDNVSAWYVGRCCAMPVPYPKDTSPVCVRESRVSFQFSLVWDILELKEWCACGTWDQSSAQLACLMMMMLLLLLLTCRPVMCVCVCVGWVRLGGLVAR